MRKTLLALVVLALALTTAPGAALPPAAGGALASDNVEFLLRIPEPGTMGGRILGNTLYVTSNLGLRIFDVSIPSVPVLLGALPIPHAGNEDVDTNGEILLISTDHELSVNNTLYVIDVRNPRVPILLSRFASPSRSHTGSCILNCRYAWLAGSNHIAVVDLSNPAAPVLAGRFFRDGTSSSANGTFGLSHDVNVDANGIAWISSANGLFAYDPSVSAVSPQPVAARPQGTPTSFVNDFILHNSLRPNASATTPTKLEDTVVDPGEVVLVTEENWVTLDNGFCRDDGSFQTGWVRSVNGALTVEKLDSIHLGQGGPLPEQKPQPIATCSSHYFDYRDGLAAVTWYEQGLRLFDVSDPLNIKSVGYFMGVDTTAVAALFHQDVVYVFDLVRGIDVIRVTGSPSAAASVEPPLRATPATTVPSAQFGFACRVA